MNKPRSILKYPGSKWRMAEKIVSLMPEHRSYLEPFFGSGAVFFSKPRSRIETINDLDGEIVNLFRVVRDMAEELEREVALTPYSREEYERAWERYKAGDVKDPVKLARQIMVEYERDGQPIGITFLRTEGGTKQGRSQERTSYCV